MNQEIERRIYIKDGIFYLAYRWRSILLAAIIGLLLMVGLKYIFYEPMDDASAKELQEDYERELQVYNIGKDSYESQIDSYNHQLEQYQRYMEDSILMKIDPMQEYYASASLYVEIPVKYLNEIPESANMDITDQVLGAYENFVRNGIDLSEFAKEKKMDEAMLQELIAGMADYESNQIEVKVIAPDEDLATTLLDEVLEQLQSQSAEINKTVRAHDEKVLNKVSGVCVDEDLLDTRREINTQINAVQSLLTTSKTNLDKLQKPEEVVVDTGDSALKKSLLKFGIVGFLLGAFVIIALYACIYLFSGFVITETELKDTFGCFMLGAFAPKYKKQYFVDKWLYTMADEEKRSDEVIANRIAKNIMSLSKTGQTILLTGTVSDEILQSTLTALKDKTEGVNLLVSGCFLEDASAIDLMSEADMVLVVEQRKVIKFAEVEKLLETVVNMNKPLLGYIMY